MRIVNEEMNKLWKEIKPWREGARLKADAPEEVKEKYNRVLQIMDEEEEKQISMM